MNEIKNASFLDGAQGFSAGAPDESIQGAPGRIVLVGGGTLSSNYVDGPSVTTADWLEVSVMVPAGGTAQLQFEAGGSVPIPLKRSATMPVNRGAPLTFQQHRGRIKAIIAGKVRIATTGGAMYRPFIEKVAMGARPRLWTPGLHFNTDLNIPIWPSHFPAFLPDSVDIQPTPVRRNFSGDAARPMTQRMSQTPAYVFRGALELNALEYDQLEDLCYQQAEPFWFVRPDTNQLCMAYWLEDGQPAAQGSHNIIRRVSVGLSLVVA